jgi:hypothetical protein
MSLRDDQITLLLGELNGSRVNHNRGQAYLEAWDVRRWLLRIFGWGGWSFEVVNSELVHQAATQDGQRTRHTVVYRVVGRLTIRDADGREICRFEDGAAGDSVNQPSVGDAHDMALKTAMSQALKRCAVNLGDQFGLSLYNDGKTERVVIRSLPHTPADTTPDVPVDPPVTPENAEAAQAAAEPEPPAARPVVRSRQADSGPRQTPAPAAAPQAAPVSPPQMRMMHALFNQLGLKERPERLRATGLIVGRHVPTANDLSGTEAGTLLDTLTACTQQPDPVGALTAMLQRLTEQLAATPVAA